MPNGKPDPECKDCKGAGEIPLFTSSCDCDCLSRVDRIIEWKTISPERLDKMKSIISDFPIDDYFKKYEKPIMTPKLDGSRHLWEPKNG